ncbi:family 43 glycosylhydrolase [Paenibacillus sp.]|uniref:family 43 glycosylhydrolase n=1 Tax=Paenibacillus sp. TaxID=58172 RepID=UPI002D37D914|nr:family 43 glycosylhydrolase [Paenibacillus sp.]HZG83372.1 family 43 glycosylhydrolase [Paenibacillus sp.]
MPFVLCYTKEGEDKYRDLNDSMHLALSYNGKEFVPLRHNTGILFPEADLNDGSMPGCTKTLLYPWLFRFKDGGVGVVAVRRNNANRPDPLSIGSIMLYRSDNFTHYKFVGFVALDSSEIQNPRCRYEEATDAYRIEWETSEGVFGGYTEDFTAIAEKAPCQSSFEAAGDYGIPDAVPGNVVAITMEEAKHIEHTLGVIYNTGVKPIEVTVHVGDTLDVLKLPKAICEYNDGSEHSMPVDWDRATLESIDTSEPGEYTVPGRIIQKVYPFPFIEHASDPCIFKYFNKYFFMATGRRSVNVRVSDTIDGLRDAEIIEIYKIPEEDQESGNMWAQEMHIINGIPYVFTTIGKNNMWNTVQSVILRCNGDPTDPTAWEAPRYVVKADGTILNENGITLDMTYFCIDDVHYVSWSNRDILYNGDNRNEYGTSNGPADIYIATIDPNAPWQLTSDPVCICRPIYGWDRIETEVDEGPYLLRHNDDLFITFSGSSVGVLYCVGLLHAKYGSDLLSPESWTETPYPILTKESIPGQYGPGHNNFIKDPDSDDDLIVLHARPYATGQDENPRHATIRRVHWNAGGYPVLEMTPEQELNPQFANVSVKIRVINVT